MAQNFSLSVIFKAIDQMTVPLRKMGQGINKLNTPIKKVSKSLKTLGKTSIKTGQSISKIGKDLSIKVTAPIVGFGTLAIRSAMSFQEAMNMVGAVTKTTGLPAFEALEEQAKQLGRETAFSATEAANAMKFLGMSGMSASEIMGAIPKVLQLASAAQLDLASSADIVTNIMRGMGLEIKDLARVNDVLVNAMTNANVDLSMLGEAFKYAGPIAKGAGLDIETTAALIAKMGDAGIQGSMAGTALRGMLLRLQNPAKNVSKIIKALAAEMEKSNDKSERVASKGMFDLVGMIEQLEKKGATAAQIAKLVGDRAGPGLAVLVDQGVDSLEKFIEKLREQGTAAKVQKAQMQGLPGAWKELKSAFEGLQLTLMDTDFGGWVENSMRGVKKLLGWLSNLNPDLQKFGIIMAMTAAVVGPALIVIGGAVTTFGLMATALGTTMGVIAGIGGLISLAIAGLISWAYTINYLHKNWDLFCREMWESTVWLWEKLTGFTDWVGNSMSAAFNSIAPDWMIKSKNWIGNKIGGEKPSTAASAVGLIGGLGGLSKSSADVNITLTADKGTTAKVERVQQKKGDVNVNLATVGYVGATTSGGGLF